jgi:hypothetical protein
MGNETQFSRRWAFPVTAETPRPRSGYRRHGVEDGWDRLRDPEHRAFALVIGRDEKVSVVHFPHHQARPMGSQSSPLHMYS